MKTGFRRLGIVTLSILTWTGTASLFNESEPGTGAHFNALLLGSALACLVALIILEIADRGRRLVDATRQETIMAELILADPGYVHNFQDERTRDEGIAWRSPTLEEKAAGPDREWIDVSHPVEAEGLG